MSVAALFLLICISSLLLAFIAVERARDFSSYDLTVAVAIGAMAGVSRIPFSTLPGVQPATFLVICSGAVFGSRSGVLVGIITALVSNTILGHGAWTLVQMAGWALIGMLSGLIFFLPEPVVAVSARRATLAAWGFIASMFFGWFMNLWFWLAFSFPLSLGTWIATVLTSLWFDIAHGLTTATLLAIGGSDLINLLSKYRSSAYERKAEFIEAIEASN